MLLCHSILFMSDRWTISITYQLKYGGSRGTSNQWRCGFWIACEYFRGQGNASRKGRRVVTDGWRFLSFYCLYRKTGCAMHMQLYIVHLISTFGSDGSCQIGQTQSNLHLKIEEKKPENMIKIDEMSILIISIYRMLHNLHHAPDNLSFARLVMHNPASKGSKCDSPFNAKLPSPKHVWSGSCQLRNSEEYLNTILHVWRILRSEDVEYEIRDKYDLIQDRCNWQRQESKMRSGW